MTESEQHYEFSDFSGEFVDDEISLSLRIYRVAGTHHDWTLEVVDEDGNTTVWNDTFDTDQEAYEEFLAIVQREGIRTFLEGPVQTLH
jgi:hypothetical protein